MVNKKTRTAREVAEELARPALVYLPDVYRCVTCKAKAFSRAEDVRHKDDCEQIVANMRALRAERAAAFREAAEVVADKRTYDITNARNHTGAQAAAVLRALAEKETE